MGRITQLDIHTDSTFPVYGKTTPEVCARVCQILAGRSKTPKTSLYQLADLHNTDSVTFQINGQALHLPEWMEKQLSEYLSNLRNASRPEKDGFDCSSFIYHMLGIPEIPVGDGVMTGWTFHEIDSTGHFEIGDAIMTAKFSSVTMGFNEQHWMMYLGNDLFISKFWNGGDIFVTTLSEITKLYPHNSIYRAEYDTEMASRKTNRVEFLSGFSFGG